jgi:SH3-like domain-containing protein
MRFLRTLPLFVGSLCALSLTASNATDFSSVAPPYAVMYDAPTQKGRKLYIALGGMPVEVVLTNGDWARVRDSSGELSWIKAGSLLPRRTLIVEVDQATIRASENESAPAVFTAAKWVVLELAEPIRSGWIKVRHRDGETGFVKASEVWGD